MIWFLFLVLLGNEVVVTSAVFNTYKDCQSLSAMVSPFQWYMVSTIFYAVFPFVHIGPYTYLDEIHQGLIEDLVKLPDFSGPSDNPFQWSSV